VVMGKGVAGEEKENKLRRQVIEEGKKKRFLDGEGRIPKI